MRRRSPASCAGYGVSIPDINNADVKRVIEYPDFHQIRVINDPKTRFSRNLGHQIPQYPLEAARNAAAGARSWLL